MFDANSLRSLFSVGFFFFIRVQAAIMGSVGTCCSPTARSLLSCNQEHRALSFSLPSSAPCRLRKQVPGKGLEKS